MQTSISESNLVEAFHGKSFVGRSERIKKLSVMSGRYIEAKKKFISAGLEETKRVVYEDKNFDYSSA